ncbi:MAG TPA: hypothetical protein VKR56_04085 [Candidatus Cybelea sp.]|nr:hypothetical protein [Candidatus Cybelea sp.]
MLIYTRRSLFFLLAFGLVACASAGQTGSTPFASAVNRVHSLSAASGVLVFQKASIRPEAGAPALMMNFVANGPNQGGVPCIDCVSGASSGDNVGLTGPSSYVLSNTYWQYEISFTDISYKGKCKVSWTIKSGKKMIDSFSASFNLASSGGFVLYAISRSRPNYSGPATLAGKYLCGKNSGSSQEPLYFE